MAPHKITVYMVEDSPIILRVVTELLEGTEATVIGHAETAQEAIAEIAQVHPDAVTIDIRLKCGTGFDVLEALAINGEEPRPLRIMLTDYNTVAYQNAAEQLGADYFLDKATQIPQLLSALATRRRSPDLH